MESLRQAAAEPLDAEAEAFERLGMSQSGFAAAAGGGLMGLNTAVATALPAITPKPQREPVLDGLPAGAGAFLHRLHYPSPSRLETAEPFEAAAQEMGMDKLAIMSGASLRATAASTRKLRMRRMSSSSESHNTRAGDGALSQLAAKPRARDVGRRYEDARLDALLLGTPASPTPFSSCSGRQLRALREVTEQIAWQKYTQICCEGLLQESSTCFYMIVEGLVVERTHRGYEQQLGPGDYFGHIALISERPRGSTVTTLTPCLILRIPAEELHASKALRGALVDSFAQSEAKAKTMLLRTLPYFARLTDAVIRDLLPFFAYSERPRGTYLCYEGEPSRCIYIVPFGTVEAVVDGTDGETIVGRCSGTDDKPWIGELALFGAKRPASLRTTAATHLLTLEVKGMREIVKIDPSLMEVFRSAELADFYSCVSSAGGGSELLALLLRGVADVPTDESWRTLLGSNYFARRTHFAGRDEPSVDEQAHSPNRARVVPRHPATQRPVLFF